MADPNEGTDQATADAPVATEAQHPADVVSTDLATLRGVLRLVGAGLAYAHGDHAPLKSVLADFGASERSRFIGEPDDVSHEVVPGWVHDLLLAAPSDRYR